MRKKLNMVIPAELLNLMTNEMFDFRTDDGKFILSKANKEEVQYIFNIWGFVKDMTHAPIHRHACNPDVYDSIVNIANKDICPRSKQILLKFLLISLSE